METNAAFVVTGRELANETSDWRSITTIRVAQIPGEAAINASEDSFASDATR
jgi:hypothetical protein